MSGGIALYFLRHGLPFQLVLHLLLLLLLLVLPTAGPAGGAGFGAGERQYSGGLQLSHHTRALALHGLMLAVHM
jgi:hypothetical protein